MTAESAASKPSSGYDVQFTEVPGTPDQPREMRVDIAYPQSSETMVFLLNQTEKFANRLKLEKWGTYAGGGLGAIAGIATAADGINRFISSFSLSTLLEGIQAAAGGGGEVMSGIVVVGYATYYMQRRGGAFSAALNRWREISPSFQSS